MITAQTNPRHNGTPRGPATGKRWTRFEKAVPPSVRQALVQRLAGEVNQSMRVALFDVFALAEQYGVSRRQFRRFADRVPYVRQAGRPASAPAMPVAPTPLVEIYHEWADRAYEAMRELTQNVDTADVQVWNQVVSMGLLLRIFSMLADHATVLQLRDLTIASQALADLRGVGPRTSSGKPPKEDSPKHELTDEEFDAAVHKLYGIHIPR
ncbi:MAG: hypothetical protein JXB13_17610 [Phycisphaerae bacterium]|nr:hypothetical protein [Phycisphaerae bacterium]